MVCDPSPQAERLNAKHWLEIVTGSCIEADLADSAFESVEKPAEVNKFLKRSAIALLGKGWITHCTDPFGRDENAAGQFKPDEPPIKTDSKGKPILDSRGIPKVNKYYSRNEGGIPMLLKHPDPEYWQRILDDPSVPIVITEGAKKAAACISAGFPCIALSGVYNWAAPGGISPLHGYIQDFLIAGRKVYLCFDSDWESNPQVRDALMRLAANIEDFAPDIQVLIISIPSDIAKGLDDYIKATSRASFRKLLEIAVSIATFKKQLVKANGGWELNPELSLELSFAQAWEETHQKNFRYTVAGWISFDGNFWKLTPDSSVKQNIQELLERIYWVKKTKGSEKKIYDKATSSSRESCYTWLTYSLRQELKPNYTHLCFKNGYLDLRSREIRELNIDDICLTALPYNYQKNIDTAPPTFLKFIESSFGLNQLNYIRALTSMLLDPTCEWRYFPFVKGRSRTGKSTLIDLWMQMFPAESVRYGSDLEIINAPQTRASLVGCRIYAVSDFTSFLSNPGAIYDFVENRPLSLRRLFATETTSIPLYCRLVLGGVEVAKVKGARDGWEGRVRYLSTLDRIVPLKNLNLESDLAAEIPHLVSWALNMEVKERSQMLHSGFDEQIKIAAEIENDPIKAFIDDCFTTAPADFALEISSVLYPMFLAWARHTKHGVDIKEKTFVARLKSTLPEQNRKNSTTIYSASLGRPISSKSVTLGITMVSDKLFTQEFAGKFVYNPEFSEPGGISRLNLVS